MEDSHGRSPRAFLTSADPATSSFHSKPRESHIIDRQNQVFKIENAIPPEVLTGNCIPLPDNANLHRVIDSVFNTLRTHNGKFQNKKLENRWRSYFESIECTYIISDFFWYAIIKLEKQKANPDSYKVIEGQLLDRISQNYIHLAVNVNRKDKEVFLANFYDCLAQSIFYSMFFAYPKSRSKLNNEEFKLALYELVSNKLTGIPMRNNGFDNWILDLGAGNVLENNASYKSAPDSTKHSLLPPVRKTDLKRKIQDIRYSPLVSRYLQTRRYEALNAIPMWNMRYTLRNIKKEKEIDRKFAHFRKLAIKTEEQAKLRDQQYNAYSAKVDEKLRENHIDFLRHVRRINNFTKKILEEDPHEYANQIVSMYGQNLDKSMALF
jgi:hypothetical protein